MPSESQIKFVRELATYFARREKAYSSEQKAAPQKIVDQLLKKFGKRIPTRELVSTVLGGRKGNDGTKSRQLTNMLKGLALHFDEVEVPWGYGRLRCMHQEGKNGWAMLDSKKTELQGMLTVGKNILHEVTEDSCRFWGDGARTRSGAFTGLSLSVQIKPLDLTGVLKHPADFEIEVLKYLKKHPMPPGIYDSMLLGAELIPRLGKVSGKQFLQFTPIFYTWVPWFRAKKWRQKKLIVKGRAASPVFRPVMIALLAETADGFLIARKSPDGFADDQLKILMPTLIAGLSVSCAEESKVRKREFPLERATAELIVAETGIRCHTKDIKFHGWMEIPSPEHFCLPGAINTCPYLLATVRFESLEMLGHKKPKLLPLETVKLIYENRNSRDLLRNKKWVFTRLGNDPEELEQFAVSGARIHPSLRMLAALLSGKRIESSNG